jgi:RNA 2',3'-cyclic 3'-phosphodiesterase
MTGAPAAPTAARREVTRRLFFALWPDETARAGLAEALRRHVPPGASRPQRPDQWHLTLQFLGDVPEARLPAVLHVGAAVSADAAACDFVLDRIEYWKRPEVLCLAAGSIPEPLAALVQLLRVELSRRGLAVENRPYKAHVTLARRVRQAPPSADVATVCWTARRFALVESVTNREGARYVELAAWDMGGRELARNC